MELEGREQEGLYMKTLKIIGPILLQELKNCRLNMYKDDYQKPHLVFSYNKEELFHYEKDFCLDFEKIISVIRDKLSCYGKENVIEGSFDNSPDISLENTEERIEEH